MERPFELWKKPQLLREAIADLLSHASGERLAVTMTGELADCYESKREGVCHILESVVAACPAAEIWVYGVDGRFHDPRAVLDDPLGAAASNWHALATFASRFLPQRTGIVLDIGSTTTDVIPVLGGKVATRSRTDIDRLLAGELVYSGMVRTNVCALVSRVPLRGNHCPVAAEFFATTADVYTVLGLIAEGADYTTADGKPLARTDCLRRLARCVCGDMDSLTEDDIIGFAEAVAAAHEKQILTAIERVQTDNPGVGPSIIISGSGANLAMRFCRGMEDIPPRRLDEHLSISESTAACALAVATLASEEFAA
jgi:(4-(4-[2-(gamma-L-glutamylamino)ethyl]phenoxymethyl)furan-2-yl)methanamine synthase